MTLSPEVVSIFLRVLQRLKAESTHRLDGLEEHVFETPVKSGVNSVAPDDKTFGAEWKIAAGTGTKRQGKGSDLVGTAIPSIRLRLGGGCPNSIIADWLLGNETVDAEMMVEQAMEHIRSWDSFDVFSVSKLVKGHILSTVVFYAIEEFNLFESLDISEEKLLNFVSEIESRYCLNPYHNAMHAADVTQSAVAMMCCDRLDEELTDLELFSVILSCCIHDVGHIGVNNDFLVKTQHEWALVYNDTSVNENMHIRVAFEVLQIPECNIFEDFSSEDYRFVRKCIKDIVLMTDMHHHNRLMQSFDSLVDSTLAANPGLTGVTLFKAFNECGRGLTMQMIVHAADISNTCRPAQVCGRWAKRVTDEFFSQGDKERKYGLPVTPILHRPTGHLASSQLAFVMYVMKPMMKSLVLILPEFVRKAKIHMDANMLLYQDIVAEGPVSRFKTIGVDYSRLLPQGGLITDDLRIEV